MTRTLSTALLSLVVISSSTFAQDGPLRRAGRALDATGKNIRARVETEVVRGQISAQEREVLARVTYRLEWDKMVAGSAMRLDVLPGGAVVVKGSVSSAPAKLHAINLVQNTIGVTKVVDELAVVKDVKVIEAAPDPTVVEVVTPAVRVITPVAPAPVQSREIVTP